MSKIKKNLILFVVFILMLLLLPFAKVEAVPPQETSRTPTINATLKNFKEQGADAIGGKVELSLTEACIPSNALYCVNHSQHIYPGEWYGLIASYHNYTVKTYAKIVGNKIYDKNNKLMQGSTESQRTKEKTINAKLGFMMYKGGGMGTYDNLQPSGGGLVAIPDYSQTQRAIYENINTWFTTVGKYFGLSSWYDKENVDSDHKDRNPEKYEVSKEYTKEMNEYVNSLGDTENIEEPTDNTAKENLKVSSYTRDGKIYYRVGPLNWHFSGTVESINVTDENGQTINNNNILISQYKGNTENFIQAEDIKSNSNFYISVSAESGAKGISDISAKFKISDAGEIYTVELWFLESSSGSQRFMMANPTKETISKELSITTEADIDFTANLQIVKVDKDQNTPLVGVGFKVQNRELGKYVQVTNGNVNYVDNIEDATEFITDSNGRIEIEQLLIGRYVAYETKNPNAGYIAKTEGIEISTENSNNTIENEYQMGSLKIEKVDKDESTVNLPNVEFTIQALTGEQAGKYVSVDNGIAVYQEERVTVRTNAEGIIEIDNLWLGNYEITEVSNPNYGYVVDGTPHTVTINKRVETTYEFENEYRLGSLEIEKVDKDNNSTKLANVEFTIRALTGEKQGQYVYLNDDGTAGYSNTQVTVKTDTNGRIEIDQVWVGNYEITEVNNPNYGYVLDGTPQTVTVSKRATATYTMDNEYILGALRIEKVDKDNNSTKLANVEFTIRALTGEKQGQYVYLNDDGTAGYSNTQVTVKTDTNGRIEIDQVWVGNYEITEVNNPNYGYVLDGTPQTVTVSKRATATYTMDNEYMLGALRIEKVDQDNPSIKLPNVEFTIRAITGEMEGQYVYLNDDGTAGYSNTRQTVVTDQNGIIEINEMWVGDYEITEVSVSNTNYGYIVDPTVRTITINKRETLQYQITNRKEYIKLSGYVWQDIQAEKQSIRNDLYQDDEFDINDTLVSGVSVRLKEGNTVVKQTTTDENGAYLFTDVIIDKLQDYYIEFEYDGLRYQNVAVNLSKDNGSKASEGTRRQQFNNEFAEVTKGQMNNTAMVINQERNRAIQIQYELHPETASATIGDTSICDITARTNDAGYVITYERGSEIDEIKNINLGLYLRTQADLAVMQDLDNVKVEIAGYGHMYKYANRFEHMEGDETDYTQNAWNVGVRYQNPYNQLIYTRPIYEADANYEDENDSNELKVSLTYKIAIRNEETITGRVNQMVDYYDSRYQIRAIGSGIDEQGNITNPLDYRIDGSYSNDTYRKVIINTNILVQGTTSATDEAAKNQTQKYVYIQFELSRENVLNLLNEAKVNNNDVSRLPNLANIAEISSYTSYSDSQGTVLYAALDKDSVPENATPGDTSTYEDDTDTAPTVALTIANARELSGTIFEDNIDQQALTDRNIAKGNGTLDEGENHIGGVKVQLMEVDDSGNITDTVAKVYDERANNGNGAWVDAECTVESDQNGNYTISGYAPGRYAIKYTWGDGTYKIVNGNQEAYVDMVENYKSTNINQQAYENELNNNKFYTSVNESSTRTSHAVDNYQTRQEIDAQLNTNPNGEGYNFATQVTINEMTSTTPEMEFQVEYNDNDITTITYSRVTDRVAFRINNLDFGIIKRPVQSLKLKKSISRVKLTLANGQTLIDVSIDENGNLQGQTGGYLSYVKPIQENGVTTVKGLVRAELDSELIQGSIVEMEYRLTTENAGNADYASEGFYNFSEDYYNNLPNGEQQKANDIITLSPLRIIDYLDSNSVYKVNDETNERYRWQQATIQDLRNNNLVASNVIEALEDGKYRYEENGQIYEGDLVESQIYMTDYLSDANLKPIRIENGAKQEADSEDVYIVVEKVLSSAEDATFGNQAEIVLINKPGGPRTPSTPGNYIPNEEPQEEDDSTSEELIITPNTGEDRNYVLPITIGIVVVIIIGAGIVIIKKKVLSK